MACSDPGMRALLEKCGCLAFEKYFSNVTKESLTTKAVKKMNATLRQILPKTDAGQFAVKKISAALNDSESDEEEDEERSFVKEEVKVESVDGDIDSTSSSIPSSQIPNSQRRSSAPTNSEPPGADVSGPLTGAPTVESPPVNTPGPSTRPAAAELYAANTPSPSTRPAAAELYAANTPSPSTRPAAAELYAGNTPGPSASIRSALAGAAAARTARFTFLHNLARVKAEEESDDEIEIVDEVRGEVSYVGVRMRSEETAEAVTVTIEDEEEDTTAAPSPNNHSDKQPSTPETPQTSSGRKRRRDGKPAQNAPTMFTTKIIDLRPTDGCGKELLLHDKAHARLKLTPYVTESSAEKWMNFYHNFADNISTLDVDLWTWADPKEPHPTNLYVLLSHAKNIVNLSINSYAEDCCDYIPPCCQHLELPKLKTLKIRHCGEMNYEVALRHIFLASAGNLEVIDFEYKDECVLRGFLRAMKNTPTKHLQTLKFLSLKTIDNESIAMVAIELEDLAGIRAKNLEELFLGFCLWDDTRPALERVLKNFSYLKRLTIQGCFITAQKHEPSISLQFPSMPNLEFLHMGKSYKISSVFETITERPAKRRKSVRILTEETLDGTSGAGPSPSRRSTVEEPTLGEYFSVTIQLPTMPKLESIHLGTLYEIKELHFESFPALTAFRVSSPWHLNLTSPFLEQRHKTFPKVTQLQFPDSLSDYTFVGKLIRHFPNIEQCWMQLPSVKVLRAFSKHMLTRRNLRLKELDLKLQYDFASSLDWIFLDKPSREKIPENELWRINQLKSYVHWEEYARVYGIEIPDAEEAVWLENEDEFRGLGALCQKLYKTLDLKIHHVPRTLRVPRGYLKWDDKACDYANILIGFNSMEYPFSSAAWALGCLGMTVKHFKLPPGAYRRHIIDPEAFIEVDSCKTLGPKVKNEGLTRNALDEEHSDEDSVVLRPISPMAIRALPWK